MGEKNEDDTLIVERMTDNEGWLDFIAKAKSPSLSKVRIHKVPIMVRNTKDYDTYYAPKVVSIGPYHRGNTRLDPIQSLKPIFANKLLSENKETLRVLYDKLRDAETVQELRDFYEENSTDNISNHEFTKMMLLDGCFILYYIKSIFLGEEKDCVGLKNHEIVFVHQDLFLLENQIPFKVLNEVMNVVTHTDWGFKIDRFIQDNILASERRKRGWKGVWATFCGPVPKDQTHTKSVFHGDDFLLQLLQHKLTQKKDLGRTPNDRYTFRNVNELLDVGIGFKPSKTMSLAHIKFNGGWFSGKLELPPITVDDSTKPMLLNLVAYEMCSNVRNDSWVTSYICLLDSLIDHPDDVKVLRKAGVLDNSLGSDKEVAKLFNEIGTDLVPNSYTYADTRSAIQRHYDSKRNTLISELKHEYVKSPWSFIALVGGVVALFLSGVQAYFSVWGLPSECDGLCVALKNNHHL